MKMPPALAAILCSKCNEPRHKGGPGIVGGLSARLGVCRVLSCLRASTSLFKILE